MLSARGMAILNLLYIVDCFIYVPAYSSPFVWWNVDKPMSYPVVGSVGSLLLSLSGAIQVSVSQWAKGNIRKLINVPMTSED